MGNYLMPYKELKKLKICLFCCWYDETVNNKYMRHNATLLYVSHLPAHWETNTAVVSEQLMQHFFM